MLGDFEKDADRTQRKGWDSGEGGREAQWNTSDGCEHPGKLWPVPTPQRESEEAASISVSTPSCLLQTELL